MDRFSDFAPQAAVEDPEAKVYLGYMYYKYVQPLTPILSLPLFSLFFSSLH
jgi:hypothetical protein